MTVFQMIRNLSNKPAPHSKSSCDEHQFDMKTWRCRTCRNVVTWAMQQPVLAS
jgi:hypothetical protein